MASKSDRILPADLASNPRATIHSWTRYRGFFEAAFLQHPQPYLFVPEAFSAETVVSKMRDAIRGAIAFGYPSDIPADRIEPWWNEVCCRKVGDAIVIGPKDKSKLESIPIKTTNPFTYTTLTREEMDAFTVLLNADKLKGPVTISNPLPGYSTPLMNCNAHYRQDGSLILL